MDLDRSVRQRAEEGSFDVHSLPAEEIEEVVLRKDRYGRVRLTVAGDHGALTWGAYLSNAQRELARDAIIETLARRDSPRPTPV